MGDAAAEQDDGAFFIGFLALLVGIFALILIFSTQSPNDASDIDRLQTQVAGLASPPTQAKEE